MVSTCLPANGNDDVVTTMRITLKIVQNIVDSTRALRLCRAPCYVHRCRMSCITWQCQSTLPVPRCLCCLHTVCCSVFALLRSEFSDHTVYRYQCSDCFSVDNAAQPSCASGGVEKLVGRRALHYTVHCIALVCAFIALRTGHILHCTVRCMVCPSALHCPLHCAT